MITVKIPAAIRGCSPVVCVSLPDVGSFEIGERHVVKFTEDGEAHVNGWHTAKSCWALVISDPTGAAHLAWWLRSAIARISVSSHAEHLAAAGAGQHYSKFLNASSVCTAFWGLVESAALGMPVDDAGLTLLRDYAHHVAGVTNG